MIIDCTEDAILQYVICNLTCSVTFVFSKNESYISIPFHFSCSVTFVLSENIFYISIPFDFSCSVKYLLTVSLFFTLHNDISLYEY